MASLLGSYSEKARRIANGYGSGILCTVLVVLCSLYTISTSLSYSIRVKPVESSLGANYGHCLDSGELWSVEENRDVCGKRLRVFVYDLPRKFHFGLLRKKGFANPINNLPWNSSEIPDWPGAARTAKHQHSVAYYLFVDLLRKKENEYNPKAGSIAVRVSNPEEADVFFVPFLSSLAFNYFGKFSSKGNFTIDKSLQEELVSILNASKWWHRSGGRDHVIPITHPNSMRFARGKLSTAVFIVVDFGRYDWHTARLGKDVVSPYNHFAPKFADETDAEAAFKRRKTLLFFQGTVKLNQKKRFRTAVYKTLLNESGVELVRSSPVPSGFLSAAERMRSSRFCLHVSGDTASSCRLFDAIMSRCVPVIVSDRLDLPFEDAIDYSQLAVFVREADALVPGRMLARLRSISLPDWRRMWEGLARVQHHFEFHRAGVPGDAVDMIWDQVYKKLPAIRLAVSRRKRLLLPEWWDAPAQGSHSRESSDSSSEGADR